MKKQLTLIALASTMVLALAACTPTAATDSSASAPSSTVTGSSTSEPSASSAVPVKGTPITITAGDVVMTATLNDTDVAQDFADMLPVTLPWVRNFSIEYISELSAPLTETGPFYTDVQPGDIVYYNPLDSITIIYEETSSVPTLTKMGEITSSLEALRNLPDNVDMQIELQN